MPVTLGFGFTSINTGKSHIKYEVKHSSYIPISQVSQGSSQNCNNLQVIYRKDSTEHQGHLLIYALVFMCQML